VSFLSAANAAVPTSTMRRKSNILVYHVLVLPHPLCPAAIDGRSVVDPPATSGSQVTVRKRPVSKERRAALK
jgi:hypothetical protein